MNAYVACVLTAPPATRLSVARNSGTGKALPSCMCQEKRSHVADTARAVTAQEAATAEAWYDICSLWQGRV